MPGFRWVYNINGGVPLIHEIPSADTALSVGDLVNLESGTADLAATNDTAMLGAVVGHSDPSIDLNGATLTAGASGTKVRVIVNEDAVYEVTDANARVKGATLDITGATGAMAVTTNSNADVVVVEDSSATEPTRVKIIAAETWQH